MGNPIKGAGYLFTGLRFILKPGIRRYVVVPLGINALLFGLLIWLGINQFSEFTQWISAQIPEWLQWLSWILWLVFALGILLLVFFGFSLLANLIAAPFNSLLAKAVERAVSLETLNTSQISELESGDGFVAGFIPAIANEGRKLLYFAGWSIPFLILFWIPVVNLAAPLLWFLFTAWMLCLEYADYPMGNHELSFKQQKQMLKQKRFLSYGFGSMVSVATMTPIANFLVMPAAVAGATLLWVEQFKNK